jgi:hypothetical protein
MKHALYSKLVGCSRRKGTPSPMYWMSKLGVLPVEPSALRYYPAGSLCFGYMHFRGSTRQRLEISWSFD